jgi:uncharacterized membrane protein
MGRKAVGPEALSLGCSRAGLQAAQLRQKVPAQTRRCDGMSCVRLARCKKGSGSTIHAGSRTAARCGAWHRWRRPGGSATAPTLVPAGFGAAAGKESPRERTAAPFSKRMVISLAWVAVACR